MDQGSNFTFDNFIKYGCIPLLAFAAGLYYSLYLNDFYEHLVRHFFLLFSSGKIQFIYPAKDLSIFSNYTFIIATGVLFAFTVLLAIKFLSKRFFISLLIACAIFLVCTALSTLVDALYHVKNGAIQIRTRSINYNFHFILSAILYIVTLVFWNKKAKK